MKRLTAVEYCYRELLASHFELRDCQGRLVATYAPPSEADQPAANLIIHALFEEALTVWSEVAALLHGNLS